MRSVDHVSSGVTAVVGDLVSSDNTTTETKGNWCPVNSDSCHPQCFCSYITRREIWS